MRHYHLLTIAAAALILLPSCVKEESTKESSVEITVSSLSESVNVPGELSFGLEIKGEGAELSTVEVSAALADGTVLAHKSIRTPGTQSTVEDAVEIPFLAGMAEGSQLVISFEAINIEGASVKAVRQIPIVRPELPDVLYMKVGDEVLSMTKSETDPNRYSTAVGEYASIASVSIATAEDFSQAQIIWGKGEEINKAEVCAFSDVTGVSVSYPQIIVNAYTFNTVSFEIGVNGLELNVEIAGTTLASQDGLLYASIDFTESASFEIKGIDDAESAYNRDFFEAKEDGTYTFLRTSGTYDVYYSPKYNYIYVAKMTAVAPECLWVIGHGFSSTPTWNDDFNTDGWVKDDITRMGYAVKVEESKYQCSMYLSNAHEWGSFEFEVYSDLNDGKDNGFAGKTLSGFTKGVALSRAADGKPGLTSGSGFQPGYYVITFDNATGDINLNRKSDWKDHGTSGIVINGKELEIAEGYNYADISFTQGEEVSFSGIEAEALNRDFFKVADGKTTFSGVTGTYKVQYFSGYNYTWIHNETMTYPDCIYILGSGKWSAPVYPDGDDSVLWDDVAYERRALYFVVAPKVGDNTYLATMSMSTYNKDWRVLLEFYSDLLWGQEGVTPVAITGDAAARFYLDGTCLKGVDEKDDPFQPGNYKFIITSSAEGLSIDISKID